MYPILFSFGRRVEAFAEVLSAAECKCSKHKLDDPTIYENSFLSDMETIEYALEDKLNEIEGDIDFF